MAIEENLRKIQEARYGREVRGAIHDAIHDCYEDGRAGTTDLIAREQIAAERTARETAVAGAMSAITAEQAARTAAVTAEENARTAAVAAEQAAREAAVANLESIKADKTQLASPFNFKGSCLFAELPTSGNEVNDTYYVTDMTSRYSWNGTAWYQSGMSEADYTDALASVETAVQNLEDGAPGTITGELKEEIEQVDSRLSESIVEIDSAIYGGSQEKIVTDFVKLTDGWINIADNPPKYNVTSGMNRSIAFNAMPNTKYTIKNSTASTMRAVAINLSIQDLYNGSVSTAYAFRNNGNSDVEITTTESTKTVVVQFFVNSDANKDIDLHISTATISYIEESGGGILNRVEYLESKIKKNSGSEADIPLQYTVDSEGHFTKGFLRLPQNYDRDGKPVPLIVFVHGSGYYQNINSTNWTGSYDHLYKYLADCGYAVFDCFGASNKYNITAPHTYGLPINRKCYKAGVEYVTNTYNVDSNNVFVTCKSLGGIEGLAFYHDNDINVQAVGMFAPEIDPIAVDCGYSRAERKMFIAEALTEDVNSVLDTDTVDRTNDDFMAYMKENASYFSGNNPNYVGCICGIEEKIESSVNRLADSYKDNTPTVSTNRPLKIWHAQDDPNTNYTKNLRLVNSLRKTGMRAEMRTLPNGTGGHYAMDIGHDGQTPIQTTNVTTVLGIHYDTIPTAYYELVEFFDRYRC